MPAKKTRQSLDLQEDFRLLIELNERAKRCVERAIELRKAGRAAAADRAENEAKKWLRKGMAIEARYPKPTRREFN